MIKNEQERERIGRRIAGLRKRRKLTQVQLAELTGLQGPHIARIEKGRYSVGFDTLTAIAQALGCEVDFIEKE